MKTVEEYVNGEIQNMKSGIGYKTVHLLTHLKSNSHETISKAIVTFDLLNKKHVSTEYKMGIFSAFKNYNNRLYVRKIIGGEV